MLFSFCKKLSMLGLLAAAIFDPALTAHQMPAIPVEQQELWEGHLNKVLAQYESVDSILQDLTLIINNDKKQNKREKREQIIEEIKNIRGIIDTIKKGAFIHVDPVSLKTLIALLQGIITHVCTAIKNNFHNVPPFEIDKYIKRNHSQADIEELLRHDFSKDFEQNAQQIKSLDTETKNIGISWFNKFYRKVDDYIIQPSLRYSIPQRAWKALFVAGTLGYFLWFRSERGTRPENEVILDPLGAKGQLQAWPAAAKGDKYYTFEYWLRDLVGPYPHLDRVTHELNTQYHTPTKNQLGLVGMADFRLSQYYSNLMPLGMIALGFGPSVINTEVSTITDWFKKKVINLHNRLRGGGFTMIKEELDYEFRVKPKFTFDDIIGMDSAKERMSLVVKYVEDPERWDRARATPAKGYLFTGDPRTGKSFFAEAVGGEIAKMLRRNNRDENDFRFFSIKASLILQHGIRQVLDMAQREAPCVLFIDEIDLLGLQRTGNSTLLNEFLISMGNAIESDPKKQVIILAATNRPENLDFALKQPGRFEKEIRFEYPKFSDRKTYLLKRLEPMILNTDTFDIDRLATETEGASFDALNAMVKTAFHMAKVLGQPITQETLDQAIDTEIRHILIDDSKNLPAGERHIVAAHQAGTALVNTVLNTAYKIAKVTIRAYMPKLKEEMVYDTFYKENENEKQKRIEYGKMFTYHGKDGINLVSREQKINMCKVQLAGHIAEELLCGSPSYAYHADNKSHALAMAQEMLAEGVKIEKMSRRAQNKLFDEAFALIETCKKEVRQLLESKKDILMRLAKALEEKLTLTGVEVQEIVSGEVKAKPAA